MSKQLIKKNLILSVSSAYLLALWCDTTISWTSPTIPILTSNVTDNPFESPLTEEEVSWLGSLINIGALVGPLPCGYLTHKIGRKYTLILTSTPFFISYILLAFAPNLIYCFVARLLAGIGVGASYTILPIYLSEMAEDHNRGFLSVTLNVFWTLGTLIPYVVGPFVTYLHFNLLLVSIVVPFLGLALCFSQRSPYFLMHQGEEEKARLVLQRIRNRSDVQVEIEMIRAGHEDKGSLLDLFKERANLKALWISLTLIIVQQAVGINAVLFYTETIFMHATTSVAPEIASIIIGLIFFLSSFILTAFADSLNRRFFLLVSTMGTFLSMLVFGGYFYLRFELDTDVGSFSWVPIACLVCFIVSYNLGLSALPWTISAELFPTQVKPISSSLVSFFCWSTSFIVTKFFGTLEVDIGDAWTFWIFAGFSILGFGFILFFVPETRGRSFQEILELLRK